ncbi:MAG: hypothetical protein RSC10_00335 [Longicatena sp.]
MLGKLMKFEFKSTYRNYMFLYFVMIIASIIISVIAGTNNYFGNVQQSGFISILFLIVGLIYGFSLVALSIAIYINIIKSYIKSMYGKGAYLTHTLPVSTTSLLLSKILTSCIWFIISIIMILISVSIISIPSLFIYGSLTMNDFWSYLGDYNLLNLNSLLYIFTSFISVVESIVLFFLIISFTHTKYVSRHRGVVGVIIYIVLQMLLGLIYNVLNISSVAFPTIISGAITANTWFSLCFTTVLVCLYFFGTKYILDKKMEVE